MNYRTLGRTGLKVSELSFGTGGFSNLGQTTGVSDQEQDKLIHMALNSGINLFDTARGYNRSEEILGRVLSRTKRDSYFLVTKWSHDLFNQEFNNTTLFEDPDTPIKSLEQSLKMLQTDYVDVLLVHGLQRQQYAKTIDRFYPAMLRLKEEGKCRFIGLSERFPVDPEHKGTTTALLTDPELWDVTMLKYGILNQYAAKKALCLTLQHNVGVLNMGAIRSNLVTPDKLEQLICDWKVRGLITPESLPDKDPLGWLLNADVPSIISAGYKFALEHPGISSVLTGTANIHHLEENLGILDSPSLNSENSRRLKDLFGDLAEPER